MFNRNLITIASQRDVSKSCKITSLSVCVIRQIIFAVPLMGAKQEA